MLTAESIAKISKQAIAEYPSECCGIVTGTATQQQVHPFRNRQDELHARDPETYPRTSREAYDIDRAELEKTIGVAAARGEQVIAFYHSHIDCGAYFSTMDKEVQTVFGEPEFPHAAHVVLSVYDRQVRAIAGFLWNGERQDFDPVPIG